MSKYDPLTHYLRAQTIDQVRMTFSDIECVIGRKLPPSSASHRAWWSNNSSNNVMTKAWLDAGFESEQVDLPGQQLLFRRLISSEHHQIPPRETSSQASRPSKLALFGWLAGTVSVAPGVDLTEPADAEWGQNLDAAHESAA